MAKGIIIKNKINERNFSEKLFSKLYRINFVKENNEKRVIKKIFELIGKTFNFGRVSYNAYRDLYHECIIEWRDKGIKSSLNYKLPDKIIKYFFKKKYKIFQTDRLVKNFPGKIKNLKTRNLIKKFFTDLDIETLIFIPISTNDKTMGSMTFDICKKQKLKPFLDENSKRLLLKTVKIITNIIKFYNIQLKLEENEKKYREIFNNTNDMVMINGLTRDGRAHYFLDANNKAIQLLKFNKNQLLKKKPQDIVTPEYLKDFPRIGHELNTKKFCIYETEIVNKYGKKIPVEINTRIFRLKNKKVALSIIRDITARKEIQNKLIEFKKLHDILINQTGLMNYDYDVKTGKINWSGAIEKITGWPIEYFNNKVDIKKWEEMIHPDDRKNVIELLKKAYREKGKYNAEYRFLHKNGNYIFLEDEGIFLTDSNNKVYRMLGVMRDVTEKIKANMLLKESEQKFKTLSEQANYGILINQDNKIIYANNAISDILEVSIQDLYSYSNKDFLNMVHPDEKRMAALYMDDIDKLRQDEIYNIQTRILTKSKKIKYIDMNFKKIIYANKIANLITIIDITSIKETEEKLKMIIKELERANTELEQFAYITSHDLQEPLRMIASYVQLLERRYKDKLDKNADDFIKFIVEGVNRMQQLIKALLDYSRIGRSAGEFKLINTLEIVKKVIDNVSYLIQKKNGKIIYDKLPDFWGNEILMEQVFQNLITNALIFSKKEVPPVITISYKKTSKGIVFSIKDNGIGIAKEYYEKIFELFKRLHTKDEYPGSGIGLSICKKIIELHNGKIWVESEPGAGSTFYFNIPVVNKK